MQDLEPLSLHPSILIVDDSLVERNLYVHMVRKWGYVVDVAVDGDTALEKIKTQNIQLVLADWQMPGMDGTELCSKVRALNFERYIYIHGTNDEARIGRAMSHGCVRLRNADVIQLVALVPVGAGVWISE